MDDELLYSMKKDRSLITIDRISEALKTKQTLHIILMLNYYLLNMNLNIKESIVESLRFLIKVLLLRDKRGNNILHIITTSDVKPKGIINILRILNIFNIKTNFVNHLGRSARDVCFKEYREYLADKKRKRKYLRF